MVADYGKDFGEWLKTFNIFNIIVPIIIAYVLCRIIPLIGLSSGQCGCVVALVGRNV